MLQNFLQNFYGPEDTTWAKEVLEGGSEGSTTHLGALGGPGVPWWVLHRLFLNKYPNIPETLGESTKINSSRRKFKKHQISLDTIMEGFIILIGASPVMCE